MVKHKDPSITADHSKFKELKEDFKDGADLTKKVFKMS